MVTAEIAVAVPALILVLTVALGAVTAVTDHLRCVDAGGRVRASSPAGRASTTFGRRCCARRPQTRALLSMSGQTAFG